MILRFFVFDIIVVSINWVRCGIFSCGIWCVVGLLREVIFARCIKGFELVVGRQSRVEERSQKFFWISC